MRSLRRVLYWFVAGFLFCPWKGPIRTLGMSFANDDDDGHKLLEDEGDAHKIVPARGLVLQGAWGNHDPSSLPPVPDPGSCTPPTDSPAPMGLRGYRRYFANDSLIGRPVPCTRDDKICFRHNLVFDPFTDSCKALGELCGETTLTVVNRTELEQGSGRAVGSCSENNMQCSGYLMAYDGVCYEKKIVDNVICGRDAKVTRHILGGMECRVKPASAISVQQPQEDGFCAIPDLNNPDSRLLMLLDDPFQLRKQLKCTSNHAACFSEVKVFVAGHHGCHRLLRQGPCAQDHVVALDFQAATEGRAEGSCVDVRGGCPKGYKRMLFDGECHEDREIAIEAPGKLFLGDFGRYFVNNVAKHILFNPVFNGNQSCTIKVIIPFAISAFPPNPLCGPDNSGKCRVYEVENVPPTPDFDDRK